MLGLDIKSLIVGAAIVLAVQFVLARRKVGA